MVDPATAAGAVRSAAQTASAVKNVVSSTTGPLVTIRAGGREDVHIRCDAFEDALFQYFYQPTAEHEVALRQAHLKLARRCNDEPTRAAAWKLTRRVIDYRDHPISQFEQDQMDAASDLDDLEAYEYTVERRRHGMDWETEVLLYRWIEEFHTVVRRGRLVRAWETTARWAGYLNPARLFRRRTTPALPTAN